MTGFNYPEEREVSTGSAKASAAQLPLLAIALWLQLTNEYGTNQCSPAHSRVIALYRPVTALSES